MGRRCSLPLALGIAGMALLPGCRERPVEHCQELIEARRSEEAATVCLAAFEATGEPAPPLKARS